MDRYEIGTDERIRAEKTALDYVGCGKDVENVEIRATKVIYIWKRLIETSDSSDGRKCLQVSGFFNWINGNGSYTILIDLNDYSIRGYSFSAGNMRLGIPDLYHLSGGIPQAHREYGPKV